jgi:hypothetical protein
MKSSVTLAGRDRMSCIHEVTAEGAEYDRDPYFLVNGTFLVLDNMRSLIWMNQIYTALST